MRQRFVRWLRGKWFDWRNRQHRENEGWCMCGSQCDQHGWGDGHLPVDMWHYHRDNYIYKRQ